MIEHVTYSYTCIDGMEFDHEEEAYAYENQYIYDRCGIMFFDDNDNPMLVVGDDLYNKSKYFTIDRSDSFSKMNKLFLEEVVWNYYGWCLPDDLLEQTATRYVYNDDEERWLPG